MDFVFSAECLCHLGHVSRRGSCRKILKKTNNLCSISRTNQAIANINILLSLLYILFIAGGIGITPIQSHISSLYDMMDAGKRIPQFHLLWFAKTFDVFEAFQPFIQKLGILFFKLFFIFWQLLLSQCDLYFISKKEMLC